MTVTYDRGSPENAPSCARGSAGERGRRGLGRIGSPVSGETNGWLQISQTAPPPAPPL